MEGSLRYKNWLPASISSCDPEPSVYRFECAMKPDELTVSAMGMHNQSTNRVRGQSDRDDLGEARMAKRALRDDLPQVESNDRKCLGRHKHEKLSLDYLECEGGSYP
jgi:hypothetical protein